MINRLKYLVQLAVLLLFCLCFFILGGQELKEKDIEFKLEGSIAKGPYLGGLYNPQPSNIDLNRDGTKDLVIFDRQGEIFLPFLYDNDEWVYAPEYSDIFPKDIRHWVLIVDYDQDGVEDLVCSKYVAGSGIRFFKGSYNGSWTWDLQSFYNSNTGQKYEDLHYTSTSGNYVSLIVGVKDIPALTDVDGDGDLDVLSFQESGSNVYFFKNTSIERGYGLDSLLFQLERKCWGGFTESPLGSEIFLSEDRGGCANKSLTIELDSFESKLHASSAISAFDIGNDGDKDLFIGDADSDKMYLLENDRKNGIDWMTASTTEFPSTDPVRLSAFIVPFFVDIDNDGDQDMLVSTNQALNIQNIQPFISYINEGDRFVRRSNDWLPGIHLDFGAQTAPVLEDINKDGKLDVVVGINNRLINNRAVTTLFYLENTGSPENLRFELKDNDWLLLSELDRQYFNIKPAFGDLNNDGAKDLVLGTHEGTLIYFENRAAPNMPMQLEKVAEDWQNIRVTVNASPNLIDLNGDGLLDLAIMNDQGYINYFENIGTPTDPIFEPDLNIPPNMPTLGGIRAIDSGVVGRGSIHFYKTDDNKLNVILGNIHGELKVYENVDLNTEWQRVDSAFDSLYVGRVVAPFMADIDGDLRLDLWLGNIRGGLTIYETDLISNQYEFPKSQKPIAIYPNPFQDRLTLVSSHNTSTAKSKIVIVDAFGKVYWEGILDQHDTIIDTEDWKPGVYCIRYVHMKNKPARVIIKH